MVEHKSAEQRYTMAVLRDASSASYPNTNGAKKWHVMGKEGWTACGRLPFEESAKRAMHVPESSRCKRSGCRGKWPDYRAEGDNRVWK